MNAKTFVGDELLMIQGIVDQIHILHWGRQVNLESKIYVQFRQINENFLLLSPAGCLVERFCEATQVRHYGVGDEIFSAFAASHRMLSSIYSSRQHTSRQGCATIADLFEGNEVAYVVRTFAIDWFDRKSEPDIDVTRQSHRCLGLVDSEFHITIYQRASETLFTPPAKLGLVA